MDNDGRVVYQASDGDALIGYFDEAGEPVTLPKQHEDELLDAAPEKLNWMK